MVPSPESPRACWARFTAELAARVQESNIVSESLLWILDRGDGPPARVTVESASRPADRIDCSFDSERGTITCVPGPAVPATARAFRCEGGRMRLASRKYTPESAAADVLDALVWADDE
jgi:hypothetical protein